VGVVHFLYVATLVCLAVLILASPRAADIRRSSRTSSVGSVTVASSQAGANLVLQMSTFVSVDLPGRPDSRQGTSSTSAYHWCELATARRRVYPINPTQGEARMSTKITVIYDNPTNAGAFEADYQDHLALARKVPGVQKLESAKVWPKEDGSATPAYRLLDLHFQDYDAASTAVTTAEAGAFLSNVFELATGGVRIVFADIEES